MKTLTINDQIDYLSDLFAETTVNVRYTTYSNLTESEQQQVKINFHTALKANNTVLTSDIINECESQFNGSTLPSLLRQYGYTVNNPSIFEPAANTLSNGQKVTIIKYSDFGFPVLIQTTVERTEIKPYAQYRESLKIIHKPKRKRSLYSNTIIPGEQLLIYDGWIDIDIKSLSHITTKENANVTISQSKYLSFDSALIDDIVRHVGIMPMVNIK